MPLAQNVLPALKQIVGASNVLTEKEDLIPYSFDGTAALQQMPGCVVFAESAEQVVAILDRKSTRLNSSHLGISYAVFCLEKQNSDIADRLKCRQVVGFGVHSHNSSE